MSEPEARIGNNERLFREVNERINRIQQDFGQAQTFEIVCKCGCQGCMERIALPHDQYTKLGSSRRSPACPRRSQRAINSRLDAVRKIR